MQTLLYIAIAYITSVLLCLVTFIAYSLRNRKEIMVKDDFDRIILFAIVPVFNIILLLGILAIEFYELLINIKNKFWKK